MTKILLSNMNTTWGVIAKAQSSNVYGHILSFETEQMKDEFINKYLFEGKDYKTLLSNSPEVSYTQETSMISTWKINPKDYPNESMASLMNKDFAIIEENNEIRFFAITDAQRSGQMISFTGEVDIFFTYNIKNMFNDKETEIKRGMFDRYTKNNNDEIVPLDNYQNTPLVNSESFDSDFTNLLFPTEEYEELSSVINVRNKLNTDPDWIPSDSNLSDEELKFAKDEISKIKWQIIAMATKNDKDIPGLVQPKRVQSPTDFDASSNVTELFNYDNKNITRLPYLNFVTISYEERYLHNEINNSFTQFQFNSIDKSTNQLISLSTFPRTFLETPEVLKNSLTELPTSPLPMFENMEIVVTKFESGKTKILTYSFMTTTTRDASNIVPNWTPVAWKEEKSTIPGIPNFYIGGIALTGLKKVESEKTSSFKINNNPTNLNITSKKSISNEPKLNFSPYTIFEIGSSTKTKGKLLPQFFTQNEIIFKINNSYLSSNWGYLLELKNYSNILNTKNSFLQPSLNFTFEDFTNYSLPTDINSWEEFLTRNRSSQNASFLSKGIGVGIGALGALAAPFTGGASLGLTGIALGSLAAKSASDINQQIAQRRDIKNTPNEIVNNGSTFSYDFINKSLTPYIQKKTLEPILKNQIFDHIYKYGYNFDSSLSKINEHLDTRYWFNYIEANDTFENIKLQLSSEIKQVINDTMNSGVTIWHVRDLTTFKGIKNYEYENLEMSLIGVNDDNKK